ncbi:phosphoglycolate phosphatase-like HAD superfamily hydrolase [Oxalobacteraceae bacterium GrIS 1.11]
MRSASAAGIRTFGLRTSLSVEALKGAGASAVIDNFSDQGLWQMLEAMSAVATGVRA